MRLHINLFSLFFTFCHVLNATGFVEPPSPGYEKRIKNYIDTMRIVDTHEHMFEPERLRNTYFLDFTLMLHQNSWDDLVSAGMPDTVYNPLFNTPATPSEKWEIIEPYWKKSFNTTSNRIILRAAKDLYGYPELNENTVTKLSDKMNEVYGVEWFNHMMQNICRFDYVLQESDFPAEQSEFIRYTEKFEQWHTIRSKYTIDSLAASQVEPICNLGNLVKTQENAFEQALNKGMVAVKINLAYFRTLKIEDVSYDEAKKVFKTLMSGTESFRMPEQDVRPLQDFMVHKLLELAREHNMPVCFHTGLQAGGGNYLENSDPSLLTTLFIKYPEIKFVLYHGSYPYGGKLAAIVKKFRNVWIDMNWTYSISPTYARDYLKEWLETVPVSKIMAFGGDQRCVENTYGALMNAKKVISDVLIEKVSNGDLTESEALTVAKMILHDNAIDFYKLE